MDAAERPPVIAVDVNGADDPRAAVEGALRAVDEGRLHVRIFGAPSALDEHHAADVAALEDAVAFVEAPVSIAKDPDPARALPFIQAVAALAGLNLRGLLSHAGHAYHASSEAALQEIAASEARTLQALASLARENGIEVDELSAGATPSARYSLQQDWLTEYRAGNYVYLDRTHPKHLLPTWNGHSVGYWDGDALVVDTIGFNDKSWLQPTMEPHTEEARLVQRIRRVGNGSHLEVTYTVEDRKALTSAYSYSRYFRRVADEMPEDVCNDDIQMFRDFRNDALKAQFERAREVK